MKKVVIGCGIALLVGVGFLALILYLSFRPKYKDVSDVSPFAEIVGKKITTKRKALIVAYPGEPVNKNYLNQLEDGTAFGFDSRLPTLVELPLGTEVVIDKVELHTGRVSGFTSAYLFGRVYSEEKQQEYAFQYSWGEHHVIYQDKPYWDFGLAFWQEEALEGKFYIDVP